MRAELTIAALGREPNPYRLTKLVAKATRGLHRPNSRVQETMNHALALFNESNSRNRRVTRENTPLELRHVA